MPYKRALKEYKKCCTRESDIGQFYAIQNYSCFLFTQSASRMKWVKGSAPLTATFEEPLHFVGLWEANRTRS